jgi:hypothetical protein
MAADDGVPARSSHVVWGARAGLLLMTPDPASFGALHEAIARGETLGARRGGPALAPLDADQAAAVAFFVAPGTLASAARGALRLVTRQLASDVPLVATFTHDVEWFDIVTNLGPWTWLGALAATPRDTLDDALLAALPAACADRHKAMCRAWPHAPSCNPYSIMRAPLLSRACDALTSPRRDPRTPP